MNNESSVFSGVAPALDQILGVFPLLLTALALLWVALQLFRRTLGFDFLAEMTERRNPSSGALGAGILLAAALAISGTFFGNWQESSLIASSKLFVEGIVSILLIRLGLWICDHTILSDFSMIKEVSQDRNLGAGLVGGGAAIACGLVLNGSLIGYSASFWLGIRDIVIFWSLGQVGFIAAAYGYRRSKEYDVHRLLEYDDNVAVGLTFGGFLIAVGIIMRGAVLGSGLDSLGLEVIRTVLLSLFGVVCLVGLQLSVTRFLLGRLDFVEEVEMNRNSAVGSIVASLTICFALVIAEIVKR